MIQIRNNIFETNSSSSHSIVITKEDKMLDKVDPGWRMDEDGTIKFWENDLDFGREFDLLSDWYGRLCYAIASMEETHMDKIIKACEKHIEGFKEISFRGSYWDEDHHGHIDHQSYGLLQSVFEKHDLTMEDFIFNDKYIVVVDGDESQIFDRLQGTPLFDSSKIESVESAL